MMTSRDFGRLVNGSDSEDYGWITSYFLYVLFKISKQDVVERTQHAKRVTAKLEPVSWSSRKETRKRAGSDLTKEGGEKVQKLVHEKTEDENDQE